MKIFYGWRIVAAGAVVLAFGLGMFTSTNSVFVIPVSEALNATRGQFTFYRTIITLVSACVMPLYGKAVQRFGVRRVLLVGAVMLGAVTIGYSFTTSLWHFYVLAAVNGLFLTAVSFMVIGVLVNSWFNDKKGLALGFAFSGSGVGGAVMIPVVSGVIELTDWRFAYRFMGVLGFVILIPAVIFFIKDNPEKVGLAPYTVSVPEGEKDKKALTRAMDFTFYGAVRSGRFWLLMVAFLLISAFASATNTHSAPFLTDLGYPTAYVSAVISLFMVFLTVGKIILGVVYDRYGTMYGNIVLVICILVFPIAALLSHLPAFPWIYAVAVGMSSCGVSVSLTLLLTKHFGQRDFPVIFSAFTLVSTLGPAVSIPAMGAAYDYTGSYQPAWITLLVFSVIITICLLASEFALKARQAAPNTVKGL